MQLLSRNKSTFHLKIMIHGSCFVIYGPTQYLKPDSFKIKGAVNLASIMLATKFRLSFLETKLKWLVHIHSIFHSIGAFLHVTSIFACTTSWISNQHFTLLSRRILVTLCVSNKPIAAGINDSSVQHDIFWNQVDVIVKAVIRLSVSRRRLWITLLNEIRLWKMEI